MNPNYVSKWLPKLSIFNLLFLPLCPSTGLYLYLARLPLRHTLTQQGKSHRILPLQCNGVEETMLPYVDFSVTLESGTIRNLSLFPAPAQSSVEPALLGGCQEWRPLVCHRPRHWGWRPRVELNISLVLLTDHHNSSFGGCRPQLVYVQGRFSIFQQNSCTPNKYKVFYFNWWSLFRQWCVIQFSVWYSWGVIVFASLPLNWSVPVPHEASFEAHINSARKKATAFCRAVQWGGRDHASISMFHQYIMWDGHH